MGDQFRTCGDSFDQTDGRGKVSFHAAGPLPRLYDTLVSRVSTANGLASWVGFLMLNNRPPLCSVACERLADTPCSSGGIEYTLLDTD